MRLHAVLAACLLGAVIAWAFGWLDADPAWKYLFAFVVGWNSNAIARWFSNR
jgi:hypothetical protein